MANYVDAGGIGSENRGAANIVLDAGAGANRAAVVFIAYWDNGATRTFAITAGGIEAGAPVAQVGNANDGLILAYVIPGIPAGEITVSITPSQTLFEGFFLVSTWDSVPQASPVVDSAIIAGNTGPSITIPTMSVGANEVGVGALYYYVAGASNPVASDTAMGTFQAGISHAAHQRGGGTLGWTGLGTGGGSMAVGIVLGHDDGAAEPDPPTIVSVDDDNTITSDQTDVGIAGSDFDSAMVEIRQDSVTVQQSIDSQSATTIQFDVVFDVSPSASLRHGAATLAVINQDDQEDTIGITIEPPSGHLYVDIATPDTEADNRITAVPDIESGDQIQARGEGGGSVPTGLTLNDDGTFEFSSGNTPESFDVRVWDVNDATWGDWATQSVGEVELAGTLESVSEALGSLDVRPALAASSESVSDAEAALDAGLGLSATVESVSGVNGSAGLSIGLSGAAESESDLSAAIGLLVGLSGAMSSVSESAGSLGMDVGLSGAAVSVSDLLGSLEVVGEFLLSGIAESVSDAEGSLSSDLGLSGVSDSVSELTAALSVSAELLLSGTSESVSEVSGALGLDMRLAGALSSESDLDAKLSLLQSLRGRSESVTQAIGALALELALSGDIESVSELLGALDRATEGGYLAVDRVRLLSALEGRIDLAAALDAEVLVQPKD